jgi:hypothetical protein
MQALNRQFVQLNEHGNTWFGRLQQAITNTAPEIPRRCQTDLEGVRMYISEQEGNTLAIEVPKMFGEQTIVFTSDCVTDGERKIFYGDATELSYSALMHSTNFIPDSQTYKFMVASANQKIRVGMGTTLYIGNAKRKDVWQKLVAIALNVIQPKIIENLLRRIFIKGEAVRIDDIEFTRDGYSRGKFFGGREQILWTDSVFVPTLHAGNVIIWGKKNNERFCVISMTTPNAVVLPELVKACVNAVSRGYFPISDGNRTGWQFIDGSANASAPRSEQT